MNYHAIVNLLFEKGLLKKIPITIPLQDQHLLDSNLIEFNNSFFYYQEKNRKYDKTALKPFSL